MPQNKPTPIQCRDTALAFIFILLLAFYFTENSAWVYGAAVLTLISMAVPKIMSCPARLWFGLSFALGKVTSTFLLTLIYVIFVVPVGFVRRLMGKDAMRFKSWRNAIESAFINRDHLFTKEDLKYPF